MTRYVSGSHRPGLRSALATLIVLAWICPADMRADDPGTVGISSMLVLADGTSAAPVTSQAPATVPDTTAVRSASEFSPLVGRWVRPDGGYVVTIRSLSAGGKLDASYANPNPLPFSRAETTRDGNRIGVFLELTAGGYGGSTYTLTYDAAKDVLRGVYYQAVARQRFDIYFEREK